jgi:hypothetical protein
MLIRLARTIGLGVLMAANALPAFAACPIELAVYREAVTGAELNFRPGATGIVSNSFRLLASGDTVLDGIVMWTQAPARPLGMVTHKCPEGDLTGDEIAACTVWEGVVYSADASGAIALLPQEGKPAPQTLILADLARGIASSPAFEGGWTAKLPWDVFSLSGCQE